MDTQDSNFVKATFVNPTSDRVSKDGRYSINALPGNLLLRKPLDYFRSILANIKGAPQSEATAYANGAGRPHLFQQKGLQNMYALLDDLAKIAFRKTTPFCSGC